jgi:hypothetical protein
VPFSELQDSAATYSRGQASDPGFYNAGCLACAQAGLALPQIKPLLRLTEVAEFTLGVLGQNSQHFFGHFVIDLKNASFSGGP